MCLEETISVVQKKDTFNIPETIMEVEYSPFVQETVFQGAMFHFHVCWIEGKLPCGTSRRDS